MEQITVEQEGTEIRKIRIKDKETEETICTGPNGWKKEIEII